MFSQYTSPKPFVVEAVEIVSADGSKKLTPSLAPQKFTANVSYISGAIGVPLTAQDMVKYLTKMSMEAAIDAKGENLEVLVPATRSDVLHAWSERHRAHGK